MQVQGRLLLNNVVEDYPADSGHGKEYLECQRLPQRPVRAYQGDCDDEIIVPVLSNDNNPGICPKTNREPR
jgi:hypothetical protein